MLRPQRLPVEALSDSHDERRAMSRRSKRTHRQQGHRSHAPSLGHSRRVVPAGRTGQDRQHSHPVQQHRLRRGRWKDDYRKLQRLESTLGGAANQRQRLEAHRGNAPVCGTHPHSECALKRDDGSDCEQRGDSAHAVHTGMQQPGIRYRTEDQSTRQGIRDGHQNGITACRQCASTDHAENLLDQHAGHQYHSLG